MTELRWNNAPEVAAYAARTKAERRWANQAGDLTPSSALVPGFPRLALIVGDRVVLEGDTLPEVAS